MYGSVLYLLCFHVLSSSPLENLKVVANKIREYYKVHHTQVRYRYMNRLSMFMRKSGFPCLRGKAAEVKHLGKALEASWRKHMRHDREIHQQIALMMKTNNQVETVLDRHKGSYKVPEPVASVLRASAHSAMQLQQHLREVFQHDERPLFTVTSKAHMLVHCAINAAFLHPQLSWCYRGEDFMRLWQRLGKNSVRGRSAVQAMGTMAQHFSIGTALDWKSA